MRVSELRRRLLHRVDEAANTGDEETAAVVLAHARAALVALAQQPGNSEVELHDLTVGTRTAALILGLHPEYVRYLIRGGRIPAKKENGEFRIALSDIGDFTTGGMQSFSQEAQRLTHLTDMLTGAQGSVALWQKPEDEAV